MALKIQPPTPLSLNISQTFKELSHTAQSLNSATDRLSQVIEKLDKALKRLNLGVTDWVKFDHASDDNMNWEYHAVGYAKVNGNWGLALKDASGNENWPDDDSSSVWLYNDAPRELRVSAIAHIPKLIESLNTTVAKFTHNLVEKTEEADALASAISNALDATDFEDRSGQPPMEEKK